MKTFSISAIALVVAFGCESDACTEIGCSDQWFLTLKKADGTAPAHTVELDMDGTHVVCPAVSLDSRFASCTDSITIQIVDEVVCEEHTSDDSQSQSCTPTGRFEENLSVRGTPVEVVVTLRDGSGATEERTFTPRYKTTQPNGPECSPTCRQASDRWDLP